MFKNICLALFALTPFFSALAQEKTDQEKKGQQKTGMEVGFHAGPGVSIFYNQNPLVNPRNPNKPFFGSTSFGVTWQYNFPKIFSLHAEMNFERKGDMIYYIHSLNRPSEGQVIITNSLAYDRIDYLTLPVTCKFSFGKTVQVFTNIGLYAGFRMNAEE